MELPSLKKTSIIVHRSLIKSNKFPKSSCIDINSNTITTSGAMKEYRFISVHILTQYFFDSFLDTLCTFIGYLSITTFSRFKQNIKSL